MSLVVTDTYAVIGRVVALALGVPYVSVAAGHNLAPGPYIEDGQADRRIETSERCLRAVELLRDRYGMPNASPFSYVDGLSPHLNLLCEPPAVADHRGAPRVRAGRVLRLAAAPERPRRAAPAGRLPRRLAEGLRLAGHVPWWYWPDLVADALETVARAVGATGDVVISVGRRECAGGPRRGDAPRGRHRRPVRCTRGRAGRR